MVEELEIQFAQKKDFMADKEIKFKDTPTEKNIKKSIEDVDGNTFLMLKCNKLKSPITVFEATPITEQLLKTKLSL